MRIIKVIILLGRSGLFKHGVVARIANLLGVSRATVCRDRQAFLDEIDYHPSCPHCRKPLRRSGLVVKTHNLRGEPTESVPPFPDEPTAWDAIEQWFNQHHRGMTGT